MSSSSESSEQKEAPGPATLIDDADVKGQRKALADVIGRFLYRVWLRRKGEQDVQHKSD